LHLGQAAAHRDLHALLLVRQQVSQVAVQPVGRVLPDRAGVAHTHVGGPAVPGGLVARLVEQAGQALGVVRVHLAPIGADLIGTAACCHTTRIGVDPGTQDSVARWDRFAAIGGTRSIAGTGNPVAECLVISVAESGMMSVCEWLQKRTSTANGAPPSTVPTWRA